jgi:hypothetical protein
MAEGFHLPTELARLYYPPPPWRLYGSALLASFRVQAETVAPLVPAPLSLVRLPGGLVTGYLAVWRYSAGSTLQYSELLAGVLARHRTRIAPYVTHAGVDSQPAQRAGRELWYLPKQLWQFEWTFDQPETAVRVWDGIRLVCTISGVPTNAHFWPLHTSVTFLNTRGTAAATITGKFDLGVAPAPWQLQIGSDSPLVPLKPAGRLLTFALKGSADVEALHVLED